MSDSCLRDCFLDSLDAITSVRDDIGANIQDSFIVTRTWSGERVGDGTFTDHTIQILPSPYMLDLSHDVRIQRGGSYESGDLILRTINKARYTEEDLRTDTNEETVEKFIKVGDHFYRTKHIKEKFITFEIHISKVAEDETERGE